MTKISNEGLGIKIDGIQSTLDEIKIHLSKLNGQTAKNTAFRQRQSVINKIIAFFAGAVALSILKMIIGG